MDPALVQQVLDDHTTADIDERLKATLGFLHKITLTPDQVTTADTEDMRAAGVSEQAMEEALYVCFLFNIMDRLADAFDFDVPDASTAGRVAHMLFTRGYKSGSIPG